MDLRTGVAAFDAETGSTKLEGFPFALLTWVDETGFPMSAAVTIDAIEAADGTAVFSPPAGPQLPSDSTVSSDGQPHPPPARHRLRRTTPRDGLGHVPPPAGDGRLVLHADRAWGWDEAEVPFPEYVERQCGQSQPTSVACRRAGSRRAVRASDVGWLALRADATAVPVGDVRTGGHRLAIAAAQGFFDLSPRSSRHRGGGGAPRVERRERRLRRQARRRRANVLPRSSAAGRGSSSTGSSRCVAWRSVSVLMYAIAIGIGLILLAVRRLAGAARHRRPGVVLSSATRLPPLKLVYRGWGEVTTAHRLRADHAARRLRRAVRRARSRSRPSSRRVPVAILVALILYVNEMPDRKADARVGKRTFRSFRQGCGRGRYDVAAVVAFASSSSRSSWRGCHCRRCSRCWPRRSPAASTRASRRTYDQAYASCRSWPRTSRSTSWWGLILVAAYVAVLAARVSCPAPTSSWGSRGRRQ